MDDENRPRCHLSHPAYPPDYECSQCSDDLPVRVFCTTCGVGFHDGCSQPPRKITHPYHLQHPLTLFYRNLETRVISNIIPDFIRCDPDTSDPWESLFLEFVPSKSGIIFDECNWCGKDLNGNWFYRCLICSFCLDLSCAETLPPPLTIANPKSHHHSLFFLPRPLSVPCDACGLVNALEPSYACFLCNYMVHQSCIDLPRVIKITRHSHRLSYTPCHSPVDLDCRVCYKKVDIKYGQYSCNHEDCSYVAHSKCATHENVWDGKELEWEKEEHEQTEDIAPFKKVGDGLIQHFCHEHCLRLEKYDGVRDAKKQCQACAFFMNHSHQFYHCKECDFSLHEECAGLPRKLDHTLHNHPLFLDPSPPQDYNYSMDCSTCYRAFTGFRYKCSQESCDRDFKIDVRCSLVQESFTHKSHEHRLFISTSHSGEDEILCKACKGSCGQAHIHCTICEFALCYTCATIPNEVHYRFDRHPLTLCHGETPDTKYWCEVCEKVLDPTNWFYTCNKSCITVHQECVFGSTIYMKHGSTLRFGFGTVKILGNNSSTRPICHQCDNRCLGSIYYEGYKSYIHAVNSRGLYKYTMALCSFDCLRSEMYFW